MTRISAKAFLITLMILLSIHGYAEPISLPELTLTPTKTSNKSNNNDSSTVSFSNKTINNSGATNVTQFLQQQGVVSIKGNSSSSSQTDISLRGFGSNANQNSLILVDGIPDTSESNVGPNLNTLLPQNIENIGVLTGSYGAEYGNQAVGGVVKLDTLTPDKLIRKMNIGIGNHDQLIGQALISQRLKNHVGYTLGIAADQNNHTEPHQRQEHGVINSKIDYLGEKGSASLNFLGYRDDTRVPAGFRVGGGQLAQTGDNHIETTSGLSYLKAKYFLTPKWQWQGNVSNHATDLDGIMTTPFHTNQLAWRASNQLHYQQKWLVGQDISYDVYNLSNTFRTQHANDLKQALYSTGHIPLTHGLQVNLGSRGALQYARTKPNSNEYNTHNSVLVTTAGIQWQATPRIKWYARRAGNFRFPDAKEQMWTPTSAMTLKVQRGTSYESGIDWQHDLTKIKVSIYELDLNNELALNPKPSNGSPFPMMSNLPPTRRLGLDGFLQFPITHDFLWNAQASLVKARFRSGQYDGKQIPSVSPINASTAIEYAHNDWHAQVTESYASPYYPSDDLANEAGKMPAVWLTDLSIQKTIHDITWGLTINNLFDRRYARYAYYEPAFGGDPAETDFYKADGISVVANMSVSF